MERLLRPIRLGTILLVVLSALSWVRPTVTEAQVVAGACNFNSSISYFWSDYANPPGYSIKSLADINCPDVAPMRVIQMNTELDQSNNGTWTVLWLGYVQPTCTNCNGPLHDETSYWDTVSDTLYRGYSFAIMQAPPGQQFAAPPPSSSYGSCWLSSANTQMNCELFRYFSWTRYVNRGGPSLTGISANVNVAMVAV